MIRVRVFRRAGRPFFEAQWEDAVTGRKRTRSTKRAVRRDAERFAAKLEEKLNSGQYRDPSRTTWEEARTLYVAEVFPGQRPKTRRKMLDTFKLVETVLSPAWLRGVAEDQIGELITHLRLQGRADLTVKGHLANLRRFLRWAETRKLVDRVPSIDMPRNVIGGMKGRAPTAEEFDRLIAAVPNEVGAELAPEWERVLRGLWLSGLRLAEAWVLDWTDDSKLAVDLSGRRPMFRIQAASEKGRKFRLLPMTPDFYEFLLKTPPEGRHGKVFNPLSPRSQTRPEVDWASKIIVAIGAGAKVKVSERVKRGKNGEPVTVVKYASAHDLRRAFGYRWSLKVRAPVLMQLMRHESIQTTLQYYIGRDAEAAADELWRDGANEFANSGHRRPRAKSDRST